MPNAIIASGPEALMTLEELDALLAQDKLDNPIKHAAKEANGEFEKFRQELIAKRKAAGLDAEVKEDEKPKRGRPAKKVEEKVEPSEIVSQ